MPRTLTIVAGMHRSGTSLVARMLEVFGIRLPGELVGPAADNPTGFFEDSAIVDLNEAILHQLGCRWDSVSGFFLNVDDFSGAAFDELKARADALLAERKALDVDWAFKDPRVSRLLGFWLPRIEAADIPCRLVVAVRKPAEVAASLARRNGFAEIKSQYLWAQYLLDVLTTAGRFARDVPLQIVHYEDVVADPAKALAELADFFPDLMVDPAEQDAFCKEFVADDLRHHRDATLDQPLELASQLYACLQNVDSVQPDLSKIHQLVDTFRADARLSQLLALASRQEIQLRQTLESQHSELSEVISRQQTDIDGLRAYQQKLEADLDEKSTWLEKQSADIAELKSDIQARDDIVRARDARVEALQASLEESRKDSADLREYNGRLEKDISGQKAEIDRLSKDVADQAGYIDKLGADIEAQARSLEQQQEALAEQQDAAAQESMRLWEIIEMYRVTVEEMEQSHSWKLTAPLRIGRRLIQQAPFKAWQSVRMGIRRLVFMLPADSMLRQRLIKVYERGVLMLRGQVDSHTIRDSHRSMIEARRTLLGEKPLLSADELPELDISIVTYNSSQWIDHFVASLREQAYPLHKLHLTFVDNASTDETVARLNAVNWDGFGGYQLIESDNRGFGAGHNQGIASGKNEYVLVTNIDLEFRPDSLIRALSFAVQDDEKVASWELRQAPFEHPKFYDPVSLQTPWSAHACILFSRAALREAGGYEERIFMYGEDVELSYRFRSLGYRLRYLPAAIVNHYTYEEAGQVKVRQYQGSTLANAYLRMRYGSWFDVMQIVPMYTGLLRGRAGVADHVSVIRANVGKILANAPYFLSRRKRGAHYPFRGWDYDIVRTGAFHERQELEDTQTLVSVVTRTYKGHRDQGNGAQDRGELLLECMQSVAHQTYPNIEHVIVEDGGDSMAPYIEQFREAYPSARISYHPLPRGGRCETGNQGLALASGDLMMFLDDDDLLFADHVETCVAELQKDESLAGAYALAWEVETQFDDEHYEEKSHATPDIHHQPFDRDVLRHHNYIPIQAIVFRRSCFERQGGFDPELDNLEDWNLWIRYSLEGDFAYICKTTSMFRTPWDLEEKARRQRVLDEYLPTAIEKNAGIMTPDSNPTLEAAE